MVRLGCVSRASSSGESDCNRRRQIDDRRAILPAAARPENVNDSADDAPIIGSARSRLVLRQTRPLSLAQQNSHQPSFKPQSRFGLNHNSIIPSIYWLIEYEPKARCGLGRNPLGMVVNRRASKCKAEVRSYEAVCQASAQILG
jgi:hypothetical protein